MLGVPEGTQRVAPKVHVINQATLYIGRRVGVRKAYSACGETFDFLIFDC